MSTRRRISCSKCWRNINECKAIHLYTVYTLSPALPKLDSGLPLVEISLSDGDQTVRVPALVDSGASISVLPYDIGLQLGLKWENQKYPILDAGGNALPDTATSWVMVRDNVTKLIWEVRTDDGSVHDFFLGFCKAGV